MGSSSSKVARGAARKYPTRAPGSTPSAPPRPAASKPRAKPTPRSSGAKDDAIRADAMDPDFPTDVFSRRLQQMGVADPSPTYSPSSTAAYPPGPDTMFPPARQNRTLTALEARRRWAEAAAEDAERGVVEGRRFLDMRTVVDAMRLRDSGMSAAEVERRLRIREGGLEGLGRRAVIEHVASPS